MKEIARRAGVERTSVSRILNEDFSGHCYRPETIKKVKTIAEAHGYIPHRAASALKTGKTQKEDGISIPDAIAVAGIDDLPMSDLLTPPLTVIRQPIADYARIAVSYLQQMFENPEAKPPTRCFKGTLLIRESI